jgi:hypothetical protein
MLITSETTERDNNKYQGNSGNHQEFHWKPIFKPIGKYRKNEQFSRYLWTSKTEPKRDESPKQIYKKQWNWGSKKESP